MKGNFGTEYGNVYYSEEVIANIVGLATMECYGVVGMASATTTSGLWELIKGENFSKGVKLNFKDDELYIELYVIVEYGIKIPEVANSIIQKVKYTIENSTGLEVSGITVDVKGVRV